MNRITTKLLTLLLGWASPTIQSYGQSPFQNLDFEDGVFISIPGDPYGVRFGPAMPGWTGSYATNVTGRITYNTLSLGTAKISILGPDNPAANRLHGHYYLVLQYGSNPYGVPPQISPSLVQTGMIHATARSIRFYSTSPLSSPFLVSFHEQPIGLSLFGPATDANGEAYIWGGDISAFAGRTGRLRFNGSGFLDYIQFSPTPIPEPSVAMMLAPGMLLLFLRHRSPIRLESLP